MHSFELIPVLIILLQFLTNCSYYCSEIDFSWGKPYTTQVNSCSISDSIKTEIKSYKAVADQINEYVHKEYKGKFFKELVRFVDMFGSRLSGSTMYDHAVNYMEQKIKSINLNNAHSENVVIPNWFRGEEEAYMITPRRRKIEIVGLGQSVSTPPEGITAPIIIISTFKWLTENKPNVTGKIAVFDLKGGNRRNFKLKAGRVAYRAGALAVLGRSFVSRSIYTVTALSYLQTDFPIPIACISSEDVDLFVRLTNRGQVVTVYLKMVNTLTNLTSKNVMGDYMGRPDGAPTEVVIIQGHMDSWDISQGAQDNGCGVLMTFLVPTILQKLKLVPRRTLRSLMTVSAEFNFLGSRSYVAEHKKELPFHSGMLMADSGCAGITGYIYSTLFPKLGCLLSEILQLFPDTLVKDPTILISGETHTAGDVFVENGIPCIGLNGDTGQYYWYRHTHADTLTHVTTTKLDDILAFWTTTAYIVSDMFSRLTEFK